MDSFESFGDESNSDWIINDVSLILLAANDRETSTRSDVGVRYKRREDEKTSPYIKRILFLDVLLFFLLFLVLQLDINTPYTHKGTLSIQTKHLRYS